MLEQYKNIFEKNCEYFASIEHIDNVKENHSYEEARENMEFMVSCFELLLEKAKNKKTIRLSKNDLKSIEEFTSKLLTSSEVYSIFDSIVDKNINMDEMQIQNNFLKTRENINSIKDYNHDFKRIDKIVKSLGKSEEFKDEATRKYLVNANTEGRLKSALKKILRDDFSHSVFNEEQYDEIIDYIIFESEQQESFSDIYKIIKEEEVFSYVDLEDASRVISDRLNYEGYYDLNRDMILDAFDTKRKLDYVYKNSKFISKVEVGSSKLNKLEDIISGVNYYGLSNYSNTMLKIDTEIASVFLEGGEVNPLEILNPNSENQIREADFELYKKLLNELDGIDVGVNKVSKNLIIAKCLVFNTYKNIDLDKEDPDTFLLRKIGRAVELGMNNLDVDKLKTVEMILECARVPMEIPKAEFHLGIEKVGVYLSNDELTEYNATKNAEGSIEKFGEYTIGSKFEEYSRAFIEDIAIRICMEDNISEVSRDLINKSLCDGLKREVLEKDEELDLSNENSFLVYNTTLN
ncbi:MAG: hypothetical protein N4A47_07020 [Clostridia bacterium]|jgi:hypothetical protein|nr:hypothetical protein [Clostridia bacterium]